VEHFMKTLVTSLALSLVVALPLRAEEKPNVAKDDTDFLVKAVTCGTCEVRLSEYAARSAADARVKEFANKLVKDHQALNNTLSESAKRLKVAVVAGQEKETREKLDKLGKLKGADFDKDYLDMMIHGHQNAISLFESESKTAKDPDLKLFAANNLTTLRKHLEEARNLRNQVGK